MPNPNEMHREILESDCTPFSYTSNATNEQEAERKRGLAIDEALDRMAELG